MTVEAISRRFRRRIFGSAFHSHAYMMMSPRMTIVSQKPPDGRQARSQRTRASVARAMLDCIREGNLRPSARQVAERAGVSTRAVFRHFENMEELFDEATRIHLNTVAPKLPAADYSGTPTQRIDAFTEYWAIFFEHAKPVWKSSQLASPFSPTLQGSEKWLHAVVEQQLKECFSLEFKAMPPPQRKRRQQILLASIGHNYWAELRDHQELSIADSKRTIKEALRTLLAPLPT